MWMFCTRVDLQFFEHRPTQRIARQHPFDSPLDYPLRMAVTQVFEANALNPARITRVAIIHLIRSFISRDPNFFRVDHDDVITSVHMRRVLGFVFASQASRNFSGQTAERLIFRVNHEPRMFDILCADTYGFHALEIQPGFWERES